MTLVQLAMLGSSLFVAGAAIVSVLSLERDRTLVEWMVLCLTFGALAVPFSTFVLGRAFGGIPESLPYLTLAIFGAVLVASSAVRRRGLPRLVVRRCELAAVALAICNVAILVYYFDKYPVFPPELLVHDYLAHLQIATDPGVFLYGWLTNSLYGITQITSYLYLAYGLAALGGTQVISMRYSMLALGVFFPMVVYYTSQKVFADEKASLFTAAAYCFVTPFWAAGLLTSGLYGEFYVGLLGTLFIWLTAELATAKGPRSKGAWAAFLLAGAAVLLAHVTSLMLMLAVFIYFVLVGAAKRNPDKRFWAAIVAVLLTGSALLIADGGTILKFVLGLVSPQGIAGTQASYLGSLLGFSPFLFTFDVYVGDLALVFILAALVAFSLSFVLGRLRKASHALPVVWFLVPLAAATLTEAGTYSAFRYSLYALVPAAFLFGLGYLYFIEPVSSRLGSRDRPGEATTYRAAVTLVVVLFLVSASLLGATGSAFGDAANEHDFSRTKSFSVYDSMLWIRSNTPSQSVVFSVGLPWYWFSTYVDGRGFVTDDIGTPQYMSQLIVSWANATGGTQVPVYVAMFSLLRNSSGTLSPLYFRDTHYTLVWNDSMVLVFRYNFNQT